MLLLLPAHLQSLPESVLRGGVSFGRALQARRGRHRAGGSGALPGWRMCVAACPYKKVFYNWYTGKSEKCILCYPAAGNRAGAGVLPFLRGPYPLPRRVAV